MRHLDVPACAEHRGEVGWARGRTHERILGLKRALRFVDSVLLWIMVTVLRYHAVQPRDRVTGLQVSRSVLMLYGDSDAGSHSLDKNAGRTSIEHDRLSGEERWAEYAANVGQKPKALRAVETHDTRDE